MARGFPSRAVNGGGSSIRVRVGVTDVKLRPHILDRSLLFHSLSVSRVKGSDSEWTNYPLGYPSEALAVIYRAQHSVPSG